ncbi:MAG: DJ-1/PfpI family protein [Gammaproteobacteria bacterium]|nr:DJ-1/PfpI family protein [Gammaproteobacteria bacterium]
MASVLIPLATGFEELEAVTLIDLLTRAGAKVTSAGLQPGPVTASRGVVILPTTTLDAVMEQTFDLIVLPGGLPGADNLNSDQRIHTLLQRQQQQGKLIAAICAAPKVLHHLGLLAGRQATAYPGVLEALNANTATTLRSDSVVCDGNIVTSRGPATAMEFALTLITLLFGKERRDSVANGLLYATS